jgi:hypothetical protein
LVDFSIDAGRPRSCGGGWGDAGRIHSAYFGLLKVPQCVRPWLLALGPLRRDRRLSTTPRNPPLTMITGSRLFNGLQNAGQRRGLR